MISVGDLPSRGERAKVTGVCLPPPSGDDTRDEASGRGRDGMASGAGEPSAKRAKVDEEEDPLVRRKEEVVRVRVLLLFSFFFFFFFCVIQTIKSLTK